MYQKHILYTIASALVAICTYGCIKDSDGSPNQTGLPEINIADVTLQESDVNDTVQLQVSLSAASTTNVVVKYAAIAGSATDLDYAVLSAGQLVFEAGQTTKAIALKLVGDEVRENAEAFQIKLFNATNGTIVKDVATIKIEDDDNITAGLVIPTTGYTTPTTYAGYNLAWADEFTADTLNTLAWNYEMGAGGWGNNELQYYRPDNTSLVNGHLVITAKKQNFGNAQYTSSRLTTKGKKAFKFGRIDIRAALPTGQGLWPALWMLGSNIDVVSWPACGEIDIMELTGNLPNRSLGTAHWGPNTAGHQFKGQAYYLPGTATFNQEFHVFSLNWEADKMEYLVDDQVFYTVTPTTVSPAAYPFNKPFFFIFNVAVGGTLPGNPDGTAAFPQNMIVDYVRVFQK